MFFHLTEFQNRFKQNFCLLLHSSIAYSYYLINFVTWMYYSNLTSLFLVWLRQAASILQYPLKAGSSLYTHITGWDHFLRLTFIFVLIAFYAAALDVTVWIRILKCKPYQKKFRYSITKPGQIWGIAANSTEDCFQMTTDGDEVLEDRTVHHIACLFPKLALKCDSASS